MHANFFKIALEFTHFEVQRIAYSQELLQRLRAEHNSHASFFRNGDYIYASPEWGSALAIAPMVRLSVEESTEIVESMIRHMLFRRFHEEFPHRVLDGFAPLRFRSEREEHDVIRELVPDDLKGRVSYIRSIDVHVRSMKSQSLTQFGLLVTTQHRWVLSVSLADILEDGFPLVGCTVSESIPIPGLQGILAPDDHVLGRVLKIDGNTATIETNHGHETRHVSQLKLEPSPIQVSQYLRHRLGESSTEKILEAIERRKEESAQPANSFGDLFRIAKWFTTQKYQNSDGFAFEASLDNSLSQQSNYRIDPTRLVFDIAPGASATSPLSGLSNYGPYDSTRFDRKAPKILVIFQESSRGAATQFLARLKDGIASSSYFKRGLRDLFRLNDVHFANLAISNTRPETYEAAVDNAIAGSSSEGFDLAIVEFDDESDQFPPISNPYLRAKARLMGLGIPAQGVRESHLRDSERSHSFTLGPMALQIYAKLGGTPWLLPGSQSVDHEVVIGVGSSIQRPNLWSGAEQSRVVGLTTFFLGDGRYALGEELPSVPYDRYFETLLISLKQSIARLASEYFWKANDTVRLVFHIFKPLNNTESEVVRSLVQELREYDIRYAFVTISTWHPWLLYNSISPINSERSSWRVVQCERGENVVIDDLSCLLQLRGSKNRTNQKHRHPHAVLIRIHEQSTYRDLQFIANQIHDFSYLSWRGFFPTDLPVTIDYANRMAALSAKLSHVPNWNPACLSRYFRKKKWFL